MEVNNTEAVVMEVNNTGAVVMEVNNTGVVAMDASNTGAGTMANNSMGEVVVEIMILGERVKSGGTISGFQLTNTGEAVTVEIGGNYWIDRIWNQWGNGNWDDHHWKWKLVELGRYMEPIR